MFTISLSLSSKSEEFRDFLVKYIINPQTGMRRKDTTKTKGAKTILKTRNSALQIITAKVIEPLITCNLQTKSIHGASKEKLGIDNLTT